jgi:hypothetical protein
MSALMGRVMTVAITLRVRIRYRGTIVISARPTYAAMTKTIVNICESAYTRRFDEVTHVNVWEITLSKDGNDAEKENPVHQLCPKLVMSIHARCPASKNSVPCQRDVVWVEHCRQSGSIWKAYR